MINKNLKDQLNYVKVQALDVVNDTQSILNNNYEKMINRLI